MDNHIQLIRQMIAGIKPDAVQRDFIKFTARKIKQDLIKNQYKYRSVRFYETGVNDWTFVTHLCRIKKDWVTILNSAVGEALASKPALTTNCGEPGDGTSTVAKNSGWT